MGLTDKMNVMDFSLFLVIGVAVTGLVWLIDTLRHRGDRQPPAEEMRHAAKAGRKLPWYVDYSRSFFPVLLVVLIVRSFIVEPFRIPSESMRPTLNVGDFIAVNKYAYGLRLPVVNLKVIPVGEPQRGDIIVFRYPRDPSTNFIKRVVGLPGDEVRYEDKHLYINGGEVSRELLTNQVPDAPEMTLWEESLGAVHHKIYYNPDRRSLDQSTIVIPPGHYFVMGDNRDNSSDSRVWGLVPEENIVGRAFGVWMHWNHGLPDFTAARSVQ